MPIFASQNLTRAKERIARSPWAADIFSTVRTRADAWLAHPTDVPVLAGGWIHDYVCPEHWCALTFDSSSPHAHRCPFGETHTGNKLDAAWRVAEHRRIATAARDLGLVFALNDDDKYAKAAQEILLQYASAYCSYTGASDTYSWMLKGRAFNQALTEAIWAASIIHTYDLVRAKLAPEQDAQIVGGLLRPIANTLMSAQYDLVYRQKNLKSNYNAWLIAAIGLLGYALGDDALVERAIDSDAGFRAHLAAAILPDGFEYEGTPYYHNFVALAYSILAEAASANGRDLYTERAPQGQSIESMWRAFASLTYNDGTIPAINDGAYYRGGPFDSEICEAYEIAFARTAAPEFAWLLSNHYKNERDSWSALIFAEQDIANAAAPKSGSVLLPSIGIAALRNEMNSQQVCVSFGEYAGSHSHLDRLGIQVFPFATDPGTPLYGVQSRTDWFQQTAAHNSIVVDGKSQAQCAGKLVEWKAAHDSTTLKLAADDAYPGVKFSRVVTLANDALNDDVSLESDTEHTYDWIVHIGGECSFESPPKTTDEGKLSNEGAYQFVQVLARSKPSMAPDSAQPAARVVIRHSGKTFALSLKTELSCEIIVGTSPAHVNTPQLPRHTLIARLYARSAKFNTSYKTIE